MSYLCSLRATRFGMPWPSPKGLHMPPPRLSTVRNRLVSTCSFAPNNPALTSALQTRRALARAWVLARARAETHLVTITRGPSSPPKSIALAEVVAEPVGDGGRRKLRIEGAMAGRGARGGSPAAGVRTQVLGHPEATADWSSWDEETRSSWSSVTEPHSASVQNNCRVNQSQA